MKVNYQREKEEKKSSLSLKGYLKISESRLLLLQVKKGGWGRGVQSIPSRIYFILISLSFQNHFPSSSLCRSKKRIWITFAQRSSTPILGCLNDSQSRSLPGGSLRPQLIRQQASLSDCKASQKLSQIMSPCSSRHTWVTSFDCLFWSDDWNGSGNTTITIYINDKHIKRTHCTVYL